MSGSLGERPGREHGASPGDAERRVGERFVRASEGLAFGADPVEALESLLREELPLAPPRELAVRARALAADLVGLGVLQELLDDVEVSDVLVNSDGHVWVERTGGLERTGSVLDAATVERYVERLVGPLGLRADRSNPVVDARLADGTRVAIVMPPLALGGPLLAIRRHTARVLPLEAFGGAAVAELLTEVVRRRANVGVYGATGAGKTTLLNALAARIERHERVLTIEDVAELRLPGDHVVRLEARPGSAEGVGRVAVRDLVRAALRLRPDRLILGEVRGAEALDVVWALSTGHRGSFATWHAGSALDALRRLTTLCHLGAPQLSHQAVLDQVHAAFDVLVGVARDHAGRRRVTAVHEVGADGTLRGLLHLSGEDP